MREVLPVSPARKWLDASRSLSLDVVAVVAVVVWVKLTWDYLHEWAISVLEKATLVWLL